MPASTCQYTGQELDGSHVKLIDMPIEEFVDGLAPFSKNAQGNNFSHLRNASVSSVFSHSHSGIYANGIPGTFKPNQPSPTHAAFGDSMNIQHSLTQGMSQSTHALPEQQPMEAALPVAHPHDLKATTIPDLTSNYLQFCCPPSTGYAFPSVSVSAQHVTEMPEPQYATFPFEPRHQPHLDPSHPFDPFSRPPGQHVIVEPTDNASAPASTMFQQTVHPVESAAPEKDPFLSLLEQLVDEQSTINGTNEMDYFFAGDSHVGLNASVHGGSERETPITEVQPDADTVVGSLTN
ncbi:hypothetical protein KEM56_002735 [Ascosphaera pollenicola]|nr:hypothetical protein KEM56_002735 [Ascosphaera pollenicola]